MFETIVCVDASYIIYHILFSSVKNWREESSSADVLDTVEANPEMEKVDLTVYPDFMETVRGKAYGTMQTVRDIVDRFNSTYGNSVRGSIIFAMDPPRDAKLRSWRYMIYPDYKGGRAKSREERPFDVMKVFDGIWTYLVENERLQKTFNSVFVYADGCEADDIVATVMADDSSSGCKRLLIANDRDYLQLEDVTQMNLEGEAVEIEQPYPDLIAMTPKKYLLAKIISGDASDNIPHVFPKVAYKTAVKKYVSNPKLLMESLASNAVANARFEENKRLIDFNRMPESIRRRAREALGLS